MGMIIVRIPHWGSLRMITHWILLVPLVLEPRNRPGKSKDSKDTTVTVIKINFPINLFTSKYTLTWRGIVFSQLSKMLNQPFHPQISIDIEKISIVLNQTFSPTCTLLMYMCIFRVHWSINFDKRYISRN